MTIKTLCKDRGRVPIQLEGSHDYGTGGGGNLTEGSHDYGTGGNLNKGYVIHNLLYWDRKGFYY